MIDPSDMEIEAMQSCLKPLGDYVASVGMDRPLANYRKEDVLGLIEVILTAYQEHLVFENERLAARDQAYFEERLTQQSKVMRGSGVPF